VVGKKGRAAVCDGAEKYHWPAINRKGARRERQARPGEIKDQRTTHYDGDNI
jgi:hypothetical protein